MLGGGSLRFTFPRTWSTSKNSQQFSPSSRPLLLKCSTPSLLLRSFAKNTEKAAEPKKGGEPRKEKKGEEKQGAGKVEEKKLKKKVGKEKKEGKEQKEVSVVREREPFVKRRHLVQLIKATKAINHFAMKKKFEKGLARYEAVLSKKLKPTKITNYVMLKLFSLKGDFESFEKLYQEVLAQVPKSLEPRRIYITSYACVGEVDKLEACFQKLKEDGLKPDEGIFEQLMIGYGNKGDVEKVKSIFEQMPSEGVQPNTGAHRALLSSFGKNGKYGEMMEHFRKMKKSLLDVSTFMTVLKHLAVSQDVPQMKEVLEMMFRQNVWPTAATYDLVLETMGGRGDLEDMNALFKRMKQENVTPTAKTFSTIMYFSGRELGKPKIEEIFKLASATRINSWPEVGDAALRAYAHRGEKENFEALYKTRKGKKPINSTTEIVKEHYPEFLEQQLSIPVGTLGIEGQTVEAAPILTEGQNAEAAPILTEGQNAESGVPTEVLTESIEEDQFTPIPSEAQSTREGVAQ